MIQVHRELRSTEVDLLIKHRCPFDDNKYFEIIIIDEMMNKRNDKN